MQDCGIQNQNRWCWWMEAPEVLIIWWHLNWMPNTNSFSLYIIFNFKLIQCSTNELADEAIDSLQTHVQCYLAEIKRLNKYKSKWDVWWYVHFGKDYLFPLHCFSGLLWLSSAHNSPRSGGLISTATIDRRDVNHFWCHYRWLKVVHVQSQI